MSKPTTDTPNANIFTRVRGSIFRGPLAPESDRERKLMVLDSLILHLHPSTLPEKTLKFTLTWGLGGMTALTMMILLVTGVMLMFTYTPSPAQAYYDILNLQTNVWFGQFVRNIHYWSGNAMIVLAFLHFLRVFFTGGFTTPRQFNWVMGIALLLLTVAANFTGYLLPWDQLAYWAITVGTGLVEYIPLVGNWIQTVVLGGPEVGAATLLNFYGLHIALIPIAMLGIMSFHFWRVRKDGGVVIPRTPGEQPEKRVSRVTTIPHLVLRELVAAMVLIAGLVVFSMVVNAPLEELANPDVSPNPAKAPWYFMGIQELLLHFHPFIAAMIIPGVALLALFTLPYFDPDLDGAGIWFRSIKGRWMALAATAVAVIGTPLLILLDEFVFDFAGWLPSLPTIVSNGLVPLALVGLLLIGFYDGIKKMFKATRCETVQATFVLLLVAFVILTIIGVWFRERAWP